MKKLLITLFVLFAWAVAWAQEEDIPTTDTKAKEKINAARVAYITERLGLTPAEAEKFWPVYREYALKRQDLKQQYKQAQRSGVQDKELVDLGLKLKQQELDLEKNYSNRIMETITPQKLMNLRKAEDDFRKLILQQIQQRQQLQQRREQQRDRLQQRQQQRNN
jgi:hypothetical protein